MALAIPWTKLSATERINRATHQWNYAYYTSVTRGSSHSVKGEERVMGPDLVLLLNVTMCKLLGLGVGAGMILSAAKWLASRW
jgi:hypothetical protein